jgi:DNA topoisomerase-2
VYFFPSTSFQAFGEINAEVPATGTPKGKTTQYQKLTQLEHVLVRPDTYIGAVERTEDTMVVFDGDDIGFRTREVS